MTRTLERFARVPGVLVVGSDGLLLASCSDVSRANADTAAAISANLLSLAARSANVMQSGGATLTMIEMDAGYIVVLRMTDGAALLGHSTQPGDVRQTGYELAMLVDLIDAAYRPPPPQ